MDMTVGRLEAALLDMIPASDAEPWDRTGLLVGDPSAEVRGVLVALDPTVAAVREAVRTRCNVVVTHHPVFLDPPNRFGPQAPEWPDAGSVVYEAVSHGVALMNFHTALDVSPHAAQMLPDALGLELVGILDVVRNNPDRGYGQLCRASGCTLGKLACRARDALGGAPRVWGNAEREVRSVVCATGASGDLAELCLARGVDCLVCGEVKYHAVLAAANRGLSVIELGHDISELPLCDVLLSCISACGVPAGLITYFDQHGNWR